MYQKKFVGSERNHECNYCTTVFVAVGLYARQSRQEGHDSSRHRAFRHLFSCPSVKCMLASHFIDAGRAHRTRTRAGLMRAQAWGGRRVQCATASDGQEIKQKDRISMSC